jgi:hypothetical protein
LLLAMMPYTPNDLQICLVAVFSASVWYWKMARLSGDFSFWKHEALLGIGILEGHGVVENGDSLHLQAMRCG